MNMIDNWKQSFELFSTKELKLLIFGWIKTFKQSISTFLRYFWWLIALNLFLRIYLLNYNLKELLSYKTATSAIIIFTSLMTLSVLSIFFALLSVRASVETKTIRYFIIHAKKLFWFFVLYFLLFIPLNATTIFVGYNPNQSWFLLTTFKNPSPLNFLMLLVILPIAVFFTLDSKLKETDIIEAIKNSLKTFLHYLPFFSAFLLTYLIIYSGLAVLLSYLPHIIRLSALFCLDFCFISAISVLYTKIRHSNYQLFFNTVNKQQ